MTYKPSKKITVEAPGRVCLFGDHQDYLGLPVIACAIDRSITLGASINNDNVFRIDMPDVGLSRTISLEERFDILDERDYFASGWRVARRYGCYPTRGYDITISGDIPINAGLSSSSAMVVAWVLFLLKAFGPDDPYRQEVIGKIAYEAEVEEHNAPGGRMDQFTIACGNIVYIDTDIPFHKGFGVSQIGQHLDRLIVAESGIPKETLGTLGHLQETTWEAISRVSTNVSDFDLKSARLSEIDTYKEHLSDMQYPYFYAALRNHEITLAALDEFKSASSDPKVLGALMYDHHVVLRDYLGVSVPAIDAMIESAMKAGAYGGKIVGSGGGGSLAVLGPPENEKAIVQALKNAGAVAVYPVTVSKGAYVH